MHCNYDELESKALGLERNVGLDFDDAQMHRITFNMTPK